MANEVIGHVKCQWCGSQKASVAVSKAGLCCVTCRTCHAQSFARGAYSDAMIRQSMRPVAKAPTMPEPAPGEEIAPRVESAERAPRATPAAGEGVAAGARVAAPEPARPIEPAPKKRGAWDLW